MTTGSGGRRSSIGGSSPVLTRLASSGASLYIESDMLVSWLLAEALAGSAWAGASSAVEAAPPPQAVTTTPAVAAVES